jgi:serine phosphatase RsbU (regulator of sigma subunit)
LGILGQASFAVSCFDCAPGDTFVLITHGLLEVKNKAGEEFGMAGVKAVLARHASQPLERIWEAIVCAAQHHGKATDD